ncbi:MAG: PD-(D/E)XK nuclease-like domain-containing protein [Dichotomicrobium sp.]
MNVSTYTEGVMPTGFIGGMPSEVYHSTDAISKSGLDLIEKSPAHYKFQPPREPTPAMRIGSAIHCAILEPDRFDAEYVVAEVKTRREKAYKELVAEHGEELVLIPSEAEAVRAIQEAALSRPEVRRLVHAPGWNELSAFAIDPETGAKVRCRYDLLAKDGFAVDIKKSRDVFPHGFSRAIASYRYHVQVAFYSDIYYWITGERLSEFWLIAIEDQPPYTAVPYRLDDLAIEAGRIAYRRNLNTYAHCLASGEWPRFEPESDLITLPQWALYEMEDQLEVA